MLCVFALGCLVGIAYAATYTDTIDTSLPQGSDDPAEADDNMRRIQGGFQEILAVEHNADLTGTVITGDGTHTTVTTDSITNAGALANTGNLAVNTDKFTVAAATGNTAVAGTLGVTGVATIGDASLLATSAAPTTDAMIANKLYVDNRRAYVKISDLKSNGTSGGDFTLGAWRTRVLNTEDSDTGNNSAISSNQVTLVAGTYECRISAPAFRVNAHQTRLRNVTAGTTILLGTCEYADSDNIVGNRSFIVGRFTIAASQALEVQHRGEVTKTVDGFGVKSSLGVGELYTIAEFWKI